MAHPPDPPHANTRRRRRSDAEENAERVLAAAADLLQSDPEASLEEIAAAAGVSRVTVYRHFGSRSEVVAAARRRWRERADANELDTRTA